MIEISKSQLSKGSIFRSVTKHYRRRRPILGEFGAKTVYLKRYRCGSCGMISSPSSLGIDEVKKELKNKYQIIPGITAMTSSILRLTVRERTKIYSKEDTPGFRMAHTVYER